jgi:hypothetical protein
MVGSIDYLSPCVPKIHLFLLAVYLASDFFKSILSILMLKNLVKRKSLVINEFMLYGEKELVRKVIIDLFDVRFLPLQFVPDDF